jgi:MFS family permease
MPLSLIFFQHSHELLFACCAVFLSRNMCYCSGVLADNFDRTLVVATGAFIWSACTIGVSISSDLLQACVFTTMNGLGLALVIPCAQSLMADYYPANQRGRAFGTMQLTMSLGSMGGSLFATNIAHHQVRIRHSSVPTHRPPQVAVGNPAFET